jgi:PAS domain S-box-containing protein
MKRTVPSSEILGLAFEHGANPAIVIDPAADAIVDVNPKAAALLGMPRAALTAMRATGLHPDQMPALLVFTEAVLLKGAYWTQTLSPRHADGRLLKLEYSATLLPASGGPWLLVEMHDIAERQRRIVNQEADLFMRCGLSEWQRAERFFQDIERENRLILSAAGDGIYGVNRDGITTFLNPAAERMLGFKAAEIVGREMHRTVHHTHADGRGYPNEACPIYAAFRDGEVHKVDNEVVWRKDGSHFHVEYTSTPLRDRGALIGAVIVFRDITQRRETEEQLRRALDEVGRLKVRLERENEYLQDEIRAETRHRGIIGRGAAIQKIVSQIELVAPTDATVLITGESGTGKELIARAIHEASQRSARPLIRVNCAAIPRELFESEFFGHAKGAFTGAIRDRIGRFELADGGTLFLDEVGEIPLELQGKLLRVIQEKQLERVGEEKTRRVDVRILAATNRSLLNDVKAGRFREDLYYRLDVFPIQVVPLRDRPEDISLLAQHALDGVSRKLKQPKLRLTASDIERLRAYDWPGNVRELENVIERGAILAFDGRLRISLPVKAPAASQARQARETAEAGAIVTEAERRRRDKQNIEAALRTAEGRIFGAGGAAELLGIPPTTLASRMKTLDIENPKATRPR